MNDEFRVRQQDAILAAETFKSEAPPKQITCKIEAKSA